MDGRIPFSFPAAASFRDTGLLSVCLIGQSRWENTAGVVSELDVLFGPDENDTVEMIRAWSVDACNRYPVAPRLLEQAERRLYGVLEEPVSPSIFTAVAVSGMSLVTMSVVLFQACLWGTISRLLSVTEVGSACICSNRGQLMAHDSRLDTAESGTWQGLSTAHQSLVPAAKTPSGLTSAKYGKMPCAFPASVLLVLSDPISRCLVSSQYWETPLVNRHLDILFGEDIEAAQKLISDWRGVARQHFVDAFQRMVQLVIATFGPNSCFKRRFSRLDTPLHELRMDEDVGVDVDAEARGQYEDEGDDEDGEWEIDDMTFPVGSGGGSGSGR